MQIVSCALWICLAAPGGPASAPESIAEIVPGLASADAGQLDRAVSALEAIVFQAGRPGADEERKAVATAMAAKLTDDVPIAARVILLRSLETIGRGEVVPALAKLIAAPNDPSIREGARRALAANPHVNAKKELRNALKGADGSLRVGIIRAIGARRDFLATADLIDAASDRDSATRIVAIEALAEIGDISAVPVLEQALQDFSGADLVTIQRAYLRLGDSLVRNDERGAARRVYDKAAGFGPAFRCAALIGFARAGLQSEVARIVEALSDADPKVRGAAADAAATMPKEPMTKALLAKLEGGGDPALLSILARRGGAAAQSAVLHAASSAKDDAARAAAIRLLAGMGEGNASQPVIDVLLSALGSGGDAAAAAEEALGALPRGATGLLVSALAKSGNETRVALVRILGARRDPAALEAVQAAAKDASEPVRVAALRAIGSLGDAASAPALIEAVRSSSGAERDAAVASLARLGGEGTGKAIESALGAEKGPARAALLRVAGLRGEAWALPVLKAAAADPDPAIRLAGVEGLARSDDASALQALMAAADSSTPEIQRAAVRGCLRFADALAREKREDAAKIYLKTLDSSKEEDSLRIALRGIAETGGPESLEKILPFLREGPVARDAGRAALRIAERLPDDQQAGAKTIYERILELDPDNATSSQCVRRLRRLGVNVDVARKRGFVTHWWILAPLPNPNGSLWQRSLAPEQGVDLAKGMDLDGQSFRWAHYHTPSPRGLVALEEAGYPQSNAGAYLYAEITPANPCDGLFKLGSDDQVVCWLNGQKVHENRVNRGLEVDQDTVPVKLAAGVNRVLIKVLNDGGGWGACLRVTGRDGQPLDLAQREQ